MSEYEDADPSEPCDLCGRPMIDCECEEADFGEVSSDQFDAQNEAYK
jgi:hypothetical protein